MKILNYSKRTKIKFMGTLGALSVGFLITLSFQNCGGGFTDLSSTVDLSSAELASSSSPLSVVERYENNCEVNKDFDACVYGKLPEVTSNDFQYQNISTKIGLKIPGLKVDSEMNLVTAHYNVLSLKSLSQAKGLSNENIEEVREKLRRPASFQSNQLIEKLQALYWGEKVNNFVQENDGPQFDKISFIIDGDKTGWAPENKAIVLGQNSIGVNHALDGGVVVHLIGESLFTRATKYKDLDLTLDEGHHLSCKYGDEPVVEKGCCASQEGCLKSITAGMADYLVTQIFPQDPSIGGLATLNSDGAKICGLVRNPALNKDLTLKQAFDACSTAGQVGNIYAMAVLYSSIWYEVSAAAEVNGMSKAQVHRLFIHLLSEVQSQETFKSLLQKIRGFDANLGVLFSEEYIRRGIE